MPQIYYAEKHPCRPNTYILKHQWGYYGVYKIVQYQYIEAVHTHTQAVTSHPFVFKALHETSKNMGKPGHKAFDLWCTHSIMAHTHTPHQGSLD